MPLVVYSDRLLPYEGTQAQCSEKLEMREWTQSKCVRMRRWLELLVETRMQFDDFEMRTLKILLL
jgi:hypothetical protein